MTFLVLARRSSIKKAVCKNFVTYLFYNAADCSWHNGTNKYLKLKRNVASLFYFVRQQHFVTWNVIMQSEAQASQQLDAKARLTDATGLQIV